MRERFEIPSVAGRPSSWPELKAWPELVEANRALAASYEFEVAGVPVLEVRAMARAEALDSAASWTAGAGIAARAPGDPAAPILMTGHQPELYHCGVWVKQFAMERVASVIGASAVNVVVDSDAFDEVGFDLPCTQGKLTRCHHTLAVGVRDTCYACAAVPTQAEISTFAEAAGADARRFSEQVGERVEDFVTHAGEAAKTSSNLAEMLTRARRMHEGAGSDYLELPISALARGRGFLTFVADLVLHSRRFAEAYNAELQAHRRERRLRSDAQPFPDLGIEGAAVELPLWALGTGRSTVWVDTSDPGRPLLTAGGEVLATLSTSADEMVDALAALDAVIAPKALALTTFTRVFASDLLIHGVGGARYDEVTDAVCKHYYGVEPPAFAVVSLSMRLAGEPDGPGQAEIAAVKARMNRLDHSADQAIREVDLPGPDRETARALSAEKAKLVARISQPGADKKAIGGRIREVNAALSRLVAPLREELEAELARLEKASEETEVLGDRGYPFFLWTAEEVAATLG